MKVLSEITTKEQSYTNINQVLVSSLFIPANSTKNQDLFIVRMRMCC